MKRLSKVVHRPVGRAGSGSVLMLSVMAHILLVWMLAHEPKAHELVGGGGNPGGGSEGKTMTVTLVGRSRPGAHVEADVNEPTGQLRRIMKSVQSSWSVAIQAAAEPETDTSGPSSAAAFMDGHPATTSDSAVRGGADAVIQETQAAGAHPSAQLGTNEAAQSRGQHGHATGDMWGQVNSCWRESAGHRLSVVLEITIDDKGAMALPPRVIRPLEAQRDAIRFTAERDAISAAYACAPYDPPAERGSRRTYRISLY